MDAQALERDPALEEVLDFLKSKNKDGLQLVDVLAVAEKLINSVQFTSKQIDDAVVAELGNIKSHISNTKSEIANLPDYDEKHIPEAGKELDEIVNATEKATNTIMEQGELILSADPSDRDVYQATITDAVMQIFEACSFQDITGQRIAKVVKTLTYIEERITVITQTLGIEMKAPTEETAEEARRRKLLLHGPTHDGEGIDQSEVDDLMGEESSQDDIDALFD